MSNEIIDKPKFDFKNFFNKNKFKIISLICLIFISIIIFIITVEYKDRKNIENDFDQFYFLVFWNCNVFFDRIIIVE